jgi:hypothetical protein
LLLHHAHPFVNSCTILPEEPVLVSSEKTDDMYQQN